MLNKQTPFNSYNLDTIRLLQTYVHSAAEVEKMDQGQNLLKWVKVNSIN